MDTIEEIIQKIWEDAEWKIKEYEQEAEKKIKAIKEREFSKWEREKAKLISDGKREAESIKSMYISRANLDGRRMVMEAREEIINRAVQMLKDSAALETGEAYQKYIETALINAKNVFGDKFIIMCRPEDAEMVKRIARETAPDAKISEAPIPYGGVVISTMDGSKKMDYSVEAHISRRMNEIRRRLAELLFEGEYD